jgi:hypothetical protein
MEKFRSGIRDKHPGSATLDRTAQIYWGTEQAAADIKKSFVKSVTKPNLVNNREGKPNLTVHIAHVHTYRDQKLPKNVSCTLATFVV